MLQKKLAKSFARNKKSSFWSDVRKLKNSSHPVSPVVDGVAGSKNVFASKIESILNSHLPSSHSSLRSSIQSSVTPSDISSIEFYENDILEALSHLKTGKSDGDGVSAEHLIFATSALISPLAVYFTSLVRPIALASSISKILEHLILTKFSSYLHTSPLQFGFKPGFSTSFVYRCCQKYHLSIHS